jgi:hypothetical protein
MNRIFGWAPSASAGAAKRRSNEIDEHNFLGVVKARILANTDSFMITLSA